METVKESSSRILELINSHWMRCVDSFLICIITNRTVTQYVRAQYTRAANVELRHFFNQLHPPEREYYYLQKVVRAHNTCN
jgi:hypothetical protein